MTKRTFLLAFCLALGTQIAAAESEPLTPPTGQLAVPASDIITSGKFSYFSDLAKNSESTLSFVRTWLMELQLTFPDTIEFLQKNQRAEGFTFFDSRLDDYGRILVASKFKTHDIYLNSGLYRLPLVLLGLVDDETAAAVQKQLLEHFKLGADHLKKLRATSEKFEGAPYDSDLEIQVEFTTMGILEHLVQPSVFGAAIDGFDEQKYVHRSLTLILEAGRKGYLTPRVVSYLTRGVLQMMAGLYRQRPGQLHLIYSSQEISTLIRQFAGLPGSHPDFVVAAKQSLLGISCEMLLRATSSRN